MKILIIFLFDMIRSMVIITIVLLKLITLNINIYTLNWR